MCLSLGSGQSVKDVTRRHRFIIKLSIMVMKDIFGRHNRRHLRKLHSFIPLGLSLANFDLEVIKMKYRDVTKPLSPIFWPMKGRLAFLISQIFFGSGLLHW